MFIIFSVEPHPEYTVYHELNDVGVFADLKKNAVINLIFWDEHYCDRLKIIIAVLFSTM